MASPATETPTGRGEAVLTSKPWLVVWALAQREMVRFFRQRNRVIGALGQPLLFWLLFGAGLGPSFRLPVEADNAAAAAVGYQEYFLPGVVVLILLFTAIFSTISIIEDRNEGILQSVLVAPISRAAMVTGKLLGGTLIALVQAVAFLALGWWSMNLPLTFASAAASVGLLFVIGFALCGLGYLIAWRMDSTQGFHAVMTLFLMPLWLLSGAFFPAEGWLAWLMKINPLTYGVAALRRILYWGAPETPMPAHLPELPLSLAVTAGFAAAMFALCCFVSAQRTTGDLR